MQTETPPPTPDWGRMLWATVTGIWDALYPDANVIFCHLHSWPGSPWIKTLLMDMAFVQNPAVGFGMDDCCSFAHSSHTIPTETYVLQGLLTKFLLQELKGLQWNLSSLLYILLLCFVSEARLNIKEQVASKCFLFPRNLNICHKTVLMFKHFKGKLKQFCSFLIFLLSPEFYRILALEVQT